MAGSTLRDRDPYHGGRRWPDPDAAPATLEQPARAPRPTSAGCTRCCCSSVHPRTTSCCPARPSTSLCSTALRVLRVALNLSLYLECVGCDATATSRPSRPTCGSTVPREPPAARASASPSAQLLERGQRPSGAQRVAIASRARSERSEARRASRSDRLCEAGSERSERAKRPSVAGLVARVPPSERSERWGRAGGDKSRTDADRQASRDLRWTSARQLGSVAASTSRQVLFFGAEVQRRAGDGGLTVNEL